MRHHQEKIGLFCTSLLVGCLFAAAPLFADDAPAQETGPQEAAAPSGDGQGAAQQESDCDGQKLTCTNSLGMKFVLIKAGTFIMGTREGKGDNDERPRHQVELTRDYYLATTEVTQGQWKKVTGTLPNSFPDDDSLPIESITLKDAQEFIERLNEKAGHERYRLPTEAEWEYAARAGSSTLYFFGDSSKQLGNYAWYEGNSQKKIHPVGRKKPNPWGLFDIYGNVREFTSDSMWAKYPEESVQDPVNPLNPAEPSWPIVRGGCWGSRADRARSASRGSLDHTYGKKKDDCTGFRLALSVE